MTTYTQNELVKAINEYGDIPKDVNYVGEALDYLDYNDIMNCYVEYVQSEYGHISFRELLQMMREFYHIINKVDYELNIL